MVWNTTQSALYEAERCRGSRRASRTEERHADAPGRCAPQNKSKGLFDDGDMFLILALLYILVREKSDQTLIMALLIALLM